MKKAKTAARATKAERFVVICTDRRGVFFGRLESLEEVPGQQLVRQAIAAQLRAVSERERAAFEVLP